MKKISAFSLIEVSAVILIIGILIAGVIGASVLVKKFKIAAAQSLTKSSPIAGITENTLWLESSLESSFKDTESSNGDYVTTWYDQKSYPNKASIVAVGTGPTYSNTINYIHAVKFNGSNTNYLQVSDARFLNNTDYTIMVLEKRQSATAGYFIGDSSVPTANQTLLLGYSADAAISHSQGTGNDYTSNISTYSSSSDTPRVFTFVSDSTNGKKTYINGILAAQSSDTTKLNNITTLAIGKGYTGEIGEIAIFTRALKAEERKAAEDYLGKKYSTKVNIATANGSCLSGIVTTNGCTMDCATSSIAGLSSPSTVSDGASNVTGTCGVTGYSGAVTLSCSNGNLTKTPSTGCGCDGANGYSPSGGFCISSCSYTVTGGSPSTGTVSAGTGTINCDASSHYSGSYAYTCSGGSAITGACNTCATGYLYSGGNCNSCDTVNGYMSDGGGTCALGCKIPAGNGTTTTLVATGTTQANCNSSGYLGTMIYNCDTPGNDVTISTPCKQECTGGNTIDRTTVPGSVIHTFTSSGTLNCPTARTARVLVVAGGGAGGWEAGGGGGAGGLIHEEAFAVAAGNITVTVGAGGNATTSNSMNNNGADSVFSTLTAKGGGAGGNHKTSAQNGFLGGSGGGGAWGKSGGSGTQNQGNSGGIGQGWPKYPCGGGGGAGGVGISPSDGYSNSGNGGAGLSNTISGKNPTPIYAAGGGGCSFYEGADAGLGGSAIGGNGATSGANATAGATNTGSGGGAGRYNNGSSSDRQKGGAGGSGIVIIRYN